MEEMVNNVQTIAQEAVTETNNVVSVIQEMELQNGFGQELLWTAIDPTYLAKFRNTADKSPSNAFMALTLIS